MRSLVGGSGLNGGSAFLGGGDDGGSHGDLNGKLEVSSVGERDLLSVDGETSGLTGLVLELNETVSARAAVAHANDVGGLGLVLSEERAELLIISAEGDVGDEEGGLGSGADLSGAAGGSSAAGGSGATSSTGLSRSSSSSLSSGGRRGSSGSGGSVAASSTTAAVGFGGRGSSSGSLSSGRSGILGGAGGTGLRSALLAGDHLLLGGVTGAGQLNVDGAARDLLLVHRGDGLLSLSLVGELDEAISERTAATGDDVGRETVPFSNFQVKNSKNTTLRHSVIIHDARCRGRDVELIRPRKEIGKSEGARRRRATELDQIGIQRQSKIASQPNIVDAIRADEKA